MPNFFYVDANGQKQGPLNAQSLRILAAQKIILPHTPLETDTGHKGVAGQIPGLFAAASSPVAPATATIPVSVQSPPARQVFCTYCGSAVAEQAVACMACGVRPIGHKKHCRLCGAGLNPEQVVCVKCGAALGGGYSGFNTGGISANASRTQSLWPILLPLLMVLLFFTPQMAVECQEYIEYEFRGGSMKERINLSVLLWGWNSWFGIMALILGGLILAGKVVEYIQPNINKFPPRLYAALYGIAAFCLYLGITITWNGEYGGIWISAPPPFEKYDLESIVKQCRRGASNSISAIPLTVVVLFIATVAGIIQSWLPGFLQKAQETRRVMPRTLNISSKTHISSKTLNIYFTVWWIAAIAHTFLHLLFLLAVYHGSDYSILMSCLPIVTVIVYCVFYCLLLYQLWKFIPADMARTTPGKAVGLTFVPLFNIYWFFVAIKGLGDDMNKVLQRCGSTYRVSEVLGLFCCVLMSLAWILPFVCGHNIEFSSWLCLILAIASLIVLILFLKSVKDGAIALLEVEACDTLR